MIYKDNQQLRLKPHLELAHHISFIIIIIILPAAELEGVAEVAEVVMVLHLLQLCVVQLSMHKGWTLANSLQITIKLQRLVIKPWINPC